MSSSDDPNENTPNPFSGMPFFNDMMRAMSQQGPLNWDLATQFAQLGAVGDTPDPAPDTQTRLAFNDLAKIADLHVREISKLTTGPRNTHTEILTTTRAQWAQRTLTDFRPLFTEVATALKKPNDQELDNSDPLSAMLGNLSNMMAPAMMGMSIGSMVGALAQRSLGQYDLPLSRPYSSEILIVSSSVDTFAHDWSIAIDDMRMWVLIHELSSHAILAAPAIEKGLTSLVRQHVSAFSPDPNALQNIMSEIDPSDPDSLAGVQNLFTDPMVLMGATRSAQQEEMAPMLDAHVAAIWGYIDFVVDAVSSKLLGGSSPIAEAVRRRRLDATNSSHLVERLLGITVSREQQKRARDFISGVVERQGPDALSRLVELPENLPTPNEIDAPGLWLARIEIS